MLALYATPTPQKLLNATAATSPAHRVPCLLSPLSWGIGSESLPLMSYDASGSWKPTKTNKNTLEMHYFLLLRLLLFLMLLLPYSRQLSNKQTEIKKTTREWKKWKQQETTTAEAADKKWQNKKWKLHIETVNSEGNFKKRLRQCIHLILWLFRIYAILKAGSRAYVFTKLIVLNFSCAHCLFYCRPYLTHCYCFEETS